MRHVFYSLWATGTVSSPVRHRAEGGDSNLTGFVTFETWGLGASPFKTTASSGDANKNRADHFFELQIAFKFAAASRVRRCDFARHRREVEQCIGQHHAAFAVKRGWWIFEKKAPTIFPPMDSGNLMRSKI